MSVDVRAIVHDVLGSHGDETILDYVVGKAARVLPACRATHHLLNVSSVPLGHNSSSKSLRCS